MEIAILKDTLKALLLFAAKEDVRYYLKAVHIEAWGDQARLVTSDGHRLAVAKQILPEQVGRTSVLVPREAIEAAIKACPRGVNNVVIEVADADKPAGRDIVLSSGGIRQTVKEVDGRFTDWRRVMPAKTTGEKAHYQPEYLLDARKAYKLVSGSDHAPVLHHNGPDCGVFYLADWFIAVVMPLRQTDKPSTMASWVYEK